MLATDHRSDVARRRTGAPLTRICALATPVGPLTLVEAEGAIVAIDFAATACTEDTPLLRRARAELAEYFAGRRRHFTLPLRPRGTDFQLRAWAALAGIPYGATATYGELAHRLDSGPRAIGQACRSNPLPIVIPCHRVVASDGIGGFAGKARALDRKRALLGIEGNP